MWKWILSKILKKHYTIGVDISSSKDFTVLTRRNRDKNGKLYIVEQKVTQ